MSDTPIPPHLQRVLAERDDLLDKRDKLDAFIPSARFRDVSPEEQRLLHEQVRHMSAYLAILGERLRLNGIGPDVRAAPTGPVPKVDQPADMDRYIGTKVIDAKPMTRGDYNTARGWDIPANEDPTEPGYMVHYTDGGKSNLEGYPGYISWSPADVFEQAYRRV